MAKQKAEAQRIKRIEEQKSEVKNLELANHCKDEVLVEKESQIKEQKERVGNLTQEK